jgi:hypothetical protein
MDLVGHQSLGLQPPVTAPACWISISRRTASLQLQLQVVDS